MDPEIKRGRGKAARGGRGRGRGGRGRGRGKKDIILNDKECCTEETLEEKNFSVDTQKAIEIDSRCGDEENIASEDQPMQISNDVLIEPKQITLPSAIDMEADISQLEAPTFTTISRGPPEPMLRLKWNHKVNLIGEKVLNPMIHCCDQCEKPILIYGRMIPCKHIFCLKCARTEPVKICPRCTDKVARVEQSGLGTVFLCTHGGSRYGNTGCRRTYLSQRDLQAHINHRHVAIGLQQQNPISHLPLMENKQDLLMDSQKTRKLSESSTGVALQPTSSLLPQRTCASIRAVPGNIGSISGTTSAAATSVAHSHSALTTANLNRINANAQESHQGKERLHQTLKNAVTSSHHQSFNESVADASYYSSVLNSFGSAEGNTVRKY